MRNRLLQSFRNIQQQIPLNTSIQLNKRRSCECQECGQINKKLLYITTVLPQFQPYHHIIIKLKEQNDKLKQQKSIKMRNKRHLIQKKTINEIIQQQDNQPKRRNNRHHNTMFFNQKTGAINIGSMSSLEAAQTPSKIISKSSAILHRYNSLSPRKLFTDKRNNKFQTFSQKLKTFYLPITAPFDSLTIMKLELIEDGKAKPIKQNGSFDDFEINIRIYKFTEDGFDEQSKDNLPQLKTLLQEDEEDDDLTDDENLANLNRLALANQKSAYKNILKFHKSSLKILIDKKQLGQSNTMKQLLNSGFNSNKKLELSQRAITANMSPTSNQYCRLSPTPSLKLLEEKKKRTGFKLNPLQLKPVSQFIFPNISPLSTKNSNKKHQRFILNAASKKHTKNVSFGQLLIKV